MGSENAIGWILIYILILILIPLFLELLLRYTNGRKTKQLIYSMAQDKAGELSQPLIVFNSPTEGFIWEDKKANVFTGGIVEIVKLLNDSSSVIMVSETLEYLPTDELQPLIKDLVRASGGNLYVVSVDKNSPRIYYDYKIVNVISDSFNLPDSTIKYLPLNGVQENLHKFYSYVFMVIPYGFFTYDPVKS
jgi:hypothetical protein